MSALSSASMYSSARMNSKASAFVPNVPSNTTFETVKVNLTTENVPAPLPSALATARIIDDLGRVPYPEGVKSPSVELNANAKDGKFRYDREFLLQFMSICKEKPDTLPLLDAIGMEPADQSPFSMGHGGSGSGMRRQASGFAKGRPISVSSSMQFTPNRPDQLTRSATSHGGPGVDCRRTRTRSKRGVPPDERSKIAAQQAQASNTSSGVPLEPVAPPQITANCGGGENLDDLDFPEIVDRKVKVLLNELTMEDFDSVSDQIVNWVNKLEEEKDGRTLVKVVRSVYEKATDQAACSETYARLCRKMMEKISPKVQDNGIKNTEGKPIAGGQLFRKHLLSNCKEDFEGKTVTVASANALEDQATDAASKKKINGETEVAALYSDGCPAAKPQGLGLIIFVCELFKLQMLTERIIHQYVKGLLGDVQNPEEEKIESLCVLFTIVGQILDTNKARAHIDVYFSRMKELAKSPNVSSRMQFMLQDVIGLRERKWTATTIAKIPEINVRHGPSESQQVNASGWGAAGGSTSKAGDLSNFGKINKGTPVTSGPGNVFADGEKDSKSRDKVGVVLDSPAVLEQASQRKKRKHRSKPLERDTAPLAKEV
ncbi:hypothetical protein VKT23_000519 [Stygiomarasmius scandens]|uniref:MIF4G domain-containing protein n=1 Tax=Marasmiellus scandens TaxID=2682957 RepID=A0ABR1K6U1_9AGAR